MNEDRLQNVSKRNPSIEMFRCVVMFMIVLYHCWVHGIYKEDHSWWSLFFCAALMWHVDAFVAISGWFGIKFSLKKYWHLYSQALFYSILSMIYVFLTSGKGYGVSAGWFGGTYLMLMLVAPILNLAIEKLVELPKKDVLYIWGLMAAGIFFAWCPKHLFTAINPSGGGGFSIFMFVFLYITVRLIKLLDVQFKKWHYLVAVSFLFIGSLGTGLLSVINALIRGREIHGRMLNGWSTYDAPFVWIMAIAMLLIFVKYVRMPEWLNKVAAFVGPSTFGMYLLHDTTSFGRLIYQIPEQYLETNTTLHPTLIIIICAIVTYIIALCIDIIRRGVFVAISRLVRIHTK